jgi:hypothetical protein
MRAVFKLPGPSASRRDPTYRTADRTGLHADAEPVLVAEADLPSPIGHGGERVQ